MSEDESIKEALKGLVGTKVVVSVSEAGFARKGYWPQMSTEGTLEQLGPMKGDSDSYRVVNSDNNYCYFYTENVYLVNPFAGPLMCIHVKIDTPAEAHD
jgi:5'-3' exonuclease